MIADDIRIAIMKRAATNDEWTSAVEQSKSEPVILSDASQHERVASEKEERRNKRALTLEKS